MKLQKTSDYKKFKYLPWNRDIDATKLKELTKKMSLNNLSKDLPILVNKKFQVLDGQHRLEVCKKLKLPVWYRVADKVTINDIAFMQTNAKWRPMDYVKFWKVKENRNFILFEKFLIKYNLPVNTAMEVCGYRRRSKELIDGGQLKFGEATFQKNCHLMDRILHISRGFKYWNHRSFLRAISMIMAFKEYDHDRMMNKVAFIPFSRRGDTMSNVEMIEEVYNYKSQIKIYFSHRIKERRNGTSKNR